MTRKTFAVEQAPTIRVPHFFLLPYAIAVAAGVLILTIDGTAGTHLVLNRWNSPAADAFFSAVTAAGDGWAAVFAVLILLFVSFRSAATMAAANIGAGIGTQLLKKFFFADAIRPSKFFEGGAQLHTVPGIELYAFNSFPSGHAATAFALWFVLASLHPSRPWQIFCCCCAIVIAFSRVYLSQHFLNDVIAGSALGLGAALWTVIYFQSTNIRRNKRWDNSLLRKKSLISGQTRE